MEVDTKYSYLASNSAQCNQSRSRKDYTEQKEKAKEAKKAERKQKKRTKRRAQVVENKEEEEQDEFVQGSFGGQMQDVHSKELENVDREKEK